MDGKNYVKRIATLSGVHVDLVKSCVRDLLRRQLCILVPIFLFSNCYLPTQNMSRLRESPELRKRLVKEASADPDNPITYKEAMQMVSAFRPPAAVSDILCLVVQMQKLRVSHRSIMDMLSMMVKEGMVRRLGKYPIWEGKEAGSANSEIPAEVRALMTGAADYHEICCQVGLDWEELDAMVRRDPCVTVIYK